MAASLRLGAYVFIGLRDKRRHKSSSEQRSLECAFSSLLFFIFVSMREEVRIPERSRGRFTRSLVTEGLSLVSVARILASNRLLRDR